VVRYYGGIKLGTGGLARAYREAAATALAASPRVDRYVYLRFVVTVPFEMLSVAYRLVAPPDVTLTGEHYGETNEFTFDVRTSMAEAFGKTLDEKRLMWKCPE
jgi:putative IMPACT (imprinted ancient) family translation regulator